MSGRIKSFLTRFGLQDPSQKHRDEIRNKTCDNLFQIFLSVFDNCEDIYLTDELAKSFGVVVKNLEQDGNGEYMIPPGQRFFLPLSYERLVSYPIDENDQDTNEFLKEFRAWEKETQTSEDRCGPISRSLQYHLDQLAWGCVRTVKGEEGSKTKLMKIANWRSRYITPLPLS
jgi:hypothetical protein